MRGVRETPQGLQAYVRVQGQFYSKRFPAGTSLRALKDWREDKRVAIRTGAEVPTVDPSAATLADDVRAYFRIVQTMPSMKDRRFHLGQWAAIFGRKTRDQITAPMIRAQLEAWRATGLSGSSVNHRRTALMALYTTLDGKSARNPVRDVPRYDEGTGEIRALSHAIIYRILSYMNRNTRRLGSERGRGTHHKSGKTLARLRVMAWTGWPQAQIRKLKPEHLQLKQAQAFVTPRRKGKGVQGDWLPLLPPAVTALRRFDALNAYGAFRSDSMNQRFQAALKQYNAHRARFKRRPIEAHAYDLRHSFGVLVAALFKDDQVVQRLMLHSDPKQTQRYIRAARAYRMTDAVATLATSDGFTGVLKGLREIGETGKTGRK